MIVEEEMGKKEGEPKYKALKIVIYIINAIPIPISVVSWLATLMALASIGQSKLPDISLILNVILTISALGSMLLLALYPLAYILSLIKSIEATTKGNHIRSLKFALMPTGYLVITGVFFGIWMLFALLGYID
jgi:hypothetical protein